MLVNIDASSLHGVAQALTSKKASDWSVASYYEVASALLQMEGVRVPLPPRDPQIPRYIIRPIQDEFGIRPASDQRKHKQEALRYLQHIDDKMEAKIKHALACGWPRREYKSWLQWHVEREWKEHIALLPGLVQTENIPQIAKILEKAPDELKAINDEAQWKPESACSNPTRLQQQMFAVDVALRGLYYDKLTELSGRRRIFHPIRRAVLDTPKVAVLYPQSIIPYLVSILGNWTCAQRLGDDQKIRAWTKMLVKSRGLYRARIRQPMSDARDVAITIAKDAGVTNPIRFKYGWEKVFDLFPIATGIAVGLYAKDYGLPHEAHLAEFVAHVAAGSAVDLALKRPLHELSKSAFRIGSLADKGRWFGGRVFSYQDYKAS
jgi:hypothetical protein